MPWCFLFLSIKHAHLSPGSLILHHSSMGHYSRKYSHESSMIRKEGVLIRQAGRVISRVVKARLRTR